MTQLSMPPDTLVVDLDMKSQQLRQLNNWFARRYGDNQVPLNLLFTKDNVPFNIDGFTIGYEQTINDGENPIDIQATPINQIGKGRVQFNFPANLFAQPGVAKGHFYILDTASGQRISGPDVTFEIEEDMLLMYVNAEPFRTEWQKFLDQLLADYQAQSANVDTLSQNIKAMTSLVDNANDNAQALIKLIDQNQVALKTDLVDYALSTADNHFTGNNLFDNAIKIAGYEAVTVQTGVLDCKPPFVGYGSDTTTAVLNYAKIGPLVSITGSVKPTIEIAANQHTVIADLPTELQPNISGDKVSHGSDLNKWLLTADQTLSIERYGTTDNIAIPVGAWLPCEINYLTI